MTAAPPLLVIAGPTATGKTELAILVAEALAGDGLPADVISADSRQVYRGLDIGTAKVSATDRARAAHHGLDLVDPDERFTVADFVAEANRALTLVAMRGGVAILAGGTGLYLRAVTRGLDTAALPHDADVRTRIERELREGGLEAAVARLSALAPQRAAKIELQNPRRVERALELAELVGDAPLPAPRPYPGPIAWIGLDLIPDAHDAWILARAEAQFAAGLVDEARELRARYDPSLRAFSAIGYREAWDVIDGRATRAEAIARDAQRNRAFARRQRTWFRSEPNIEWFAADRRDLVETAVSRARQLAGQAIPVGERQRPK